MSSYDSGMRDEGGRMRVKGEGRSNERAGKYSPIGASLFMRLIPHPSSLIPLIAALLLSGCGFHLRGSATLPFNTLYVEAPRASLFATQLRRVIGAGSTTRITNNQAEADATLQVLQELHEKEILSLSAGGRV